MLLNPNLAKTLSPPVMEALEGKTELDALIAYLQGLGTELKTRK